jgi:alkyl hydroperoxide reductase subunit AhpC
MRQRATSVLKWFSGLYVVLIVIQVYLAGEGIFGLNVINHSDDCDKHGANLIGISVDGTWCHSAFANDRKLHFPLLADFEPKGDAARRYGVYRRQDGTTERALFVIDDDGVIRWSYVSPIGVNPGADGVLTALENLPKRQSAASAQASQASDR